MEFKALMAAFGADSGFGDFTPDDSGVYRVAIDDMVLGFAERADAGQLTTFAKVCAVPEEGRETFYRLLLESAFLGSETGGGAFSIERESGAVFLHRFDSLCELDLPVLKRRLEEFVNVLEQWRKLAAGVVPASVALERAVGASEDETRSLGGAGFIQV